MLIFWGVSIINLCPIQMCARYNNIPKHGGNLVRKIRLLHRFFTIPLLTIIHYENSDPHLPADGV
jgi:hypothetical protein